MTEPPRTRRGFFRSLTGVPEVQPKSQQPKSQQPGSQQPKSALAFSLSQFYAARRGAGEASTDALPEFEIGETADFGTTPVGTPELKPRKHRA